MTVFDAHKNFAFSTVATAPSPATSGTSLVVASGDGAGFPATPFNAVICPIGSQPTAANAEVVRVTARSTDTFTITRTQEGTSARTVIVGDQIFAAVTAKTLTDVETALNGIGVVPPADLGLLSMNFDPLLMVASLSEFVGNGVLTLIRVPVPTTLSVTNIVVYVGAANGAPVAGQNYAAIIDSTGARLGLTADQGSAWGSTGTKPMAITGGPISVPNTGGFVWVTLLQNATTRANWGGGTLGVAAGMLNAGTIAATSRLGSILTGQTSIPSSITPSSITQQLRPYWAALS